MIILLDFCIQLILAYKTYNVKKFYLAKTSKAELKTLPLCLLTRELHYLHGILYNAVHLNI